MDGCEARTCIIWERNFGFVIVGIVAAGVTATVIVVIQEANSQEPAEIMLQEPSGQTPIPILESVTITIPEGAATGSGMEEEFGEKYYIPEPATVSSGSQVTWINTDTVCHTATAGTPTD